MNTTEALASYLSLSALLLIGGAQVHATPGTHARQVDAIFSQWNKPDSPGCVCSVMKGGRVIYAKGYGMADLEHQVPLTPQSVFYLASMTKQFTAASIGLLVLDGRIFPNTDIHTYFPQLREYGTPVTVDHLVHHESGLRDYLELLPLAGWQLTDLITNEAGVQILYRQNGLSFEPGSRFGYSNSNYMLLAQIVEHASGQSLPKFAQSHIFAPLGMTATRFGDNAFAIVPNRVVSYGINADGSYFQFIKTIQSYGDGNLLSTADDLARWDENFYSGKVGGRPLLDLIQTRGVLNDGKRTDYGYGLMYGEYRGLPTVSHGGVFLGFRTQLVRFPQQHFSVLSLCNSASINADALTYQMADVYLAHELKPVIPRAAPALAPPAQAVFEVTATMLPEYAGRYHNEEIDTTYEIELKNGSLTLHIPRTPLLPLRAVAPDTFDMMGEAAKFTFHRNSAGHVTGFEYAGSTVANLFFVRSPKP